VLSDGLALHELLEGVKDRGRHLAPVDLYRQHKGLLGTCGLAPDVTSEVTKIPAFVDSGQENRAWLCVRIYSLRPDTLPIEIPISGLHPVVKTPRRPFDRAGRGSWRDRSLPAGSSLRLCASDQRSRGVLYSGVTPSIRTVEVSVEMRKRGFESLDFRITRTQRLKK
jgi:hypothetical protein